jgi:hypothetical protein
MQSTDDIARYAYFKPLSQASPVHPPARVASSAVASLSEHLDLEHISSLEKSSRLSKSKK